MEEQYYQKQEKLEKNISIRPSYKALSKYKNSKWDENRSVVDFLERIMAEVKEELKIEQPRLFYNIKGTHYKKEI